MFLLRPAAGQGRHQPRPRSGHAEPDAEQAAAEGALLPGMDPDLASFFADGDGFSIKHGDGEEEEKDAARHDEARPIDAMVTASIE